MLQEYIAQYEGDLKFTHAHRISAEICGIRAEIDVFACEFTENGCLSRREKAHAVLTKGDLRCECDMVDIHPWDDLFYPVTVNGTECLCFRKTLYGFTFLRTDTLTEEYDFFPAQVMRPGEESFIIVGAQNFGDFVIFDGCYWACPYRCIAYDHTAKRFLVVSAECGVWNADKSEVLGDRLLITGTDEKGGKVQGEITLADLSRLMEETGKTAFYHPDFNGF